MIISTVTPAVAIMNTTSATSIGNIISMVISNPKAMATIAIQLLMGFAVGYLLAKVAKYVLALIAVFIMGAALSVWSVGGSVEEVVAKFYEQFKDVAPIIMKFITALGLLALGPTTVGFLLGLLIGMLRK